MRPSAWVTMKVGCGLALKAMANRSSALGGLFVESSFILIVATLPPLPQSRRERFPFVLCTLPNNLTGNEDGADQPCQPFVGAIVTRLENRLPDARPA